MARRNHHPRNGKCTCHAAQDYLPADGEQFGRAAADFARELRRLPDPFTGAISALAATDVQWGMNRIDPDRRRLVLTSLRLGDIRPSKCPLSMCEGILVRLDGEKGRFAAQTLARPVLDAMASGNFPTNLGSLYLWSYIGTSTTPSTIAADARLLVSWAEYPWWLPPGVSAEQGEAVLAAARLVIEASPDFLSGAPSEGVITDITHDEPQGGDGLPAMLAENPGQRPAADSGALGEQPGNPADVAVMLEEAWAAAKDLVAVLGEELVAGRVPADMMLAPIQLLAEYAAQARRLAGADLSIPDLLAALNEAAERTKIAGQFSLLGELTGPDGPLPELTALTQSLASASQWSKKEQLEAEGIIALHYLVDLVAREGGVPADKAEFNTLAERASVLPGNLSFLAATGQLTRPLDQPAVAAADSGSSVVVSETLAPAAADAPDAGTAKLTMEPAPLVEHGGSKDWIAAAMPAPQAPEAHGSPYPVQSLADLVAERRFSAACSMAEAMGRGTAERWTYRVAALSGALRSANGSCAARLSAELRDVTMIEPEPVPLLVASTSLIRAGLITGTSDAGALLIEAVRHLDPELGAIAGQVGRTVVSGALADAPVIGILADVTELERRLDAARAQASARLARQPTTRFPRATAMAKQWMDDKSGLLGSLLSAAAKDDRSQLQRVKDEVARLNDVSEISREIDRLDHQLRLNGAKALVGGPRQNLHSLAKGALSAVSGWLEAVAALEFGARQDKTWARRAIGILRSELLNRRDAVMTALILRSESPDPLIAAAARAAATLMDDAFALLAGERCLAPGEPAADLVLTVERLKAPGARPDPETGEITLESLAGDPASDLAKAFALSWEDAYSRHLAGENYPAAAAIKDLRGLEGTLPGAPPASVTFVEAEFQAAVERSRIDLLNLRDALAVEVRRARGQNELSEQEDTDLRAILAAADPARGGRTDLHEVRRQLGEIKQSLPELRDAAAERLRERLNQVVGERQKPVDPAEPAKISELINIGKLSIADELIYCLENETDLPAWEPRGDLEHFFPAVPDVLPQGITAEHIETLRSGGIIAGLPILDSSSLSEGVRERGANALSDWRLLASTPPAGRGQSGQLEYLIGVLGLAGLEPEHVKQTTHPGNSSERRFVKASGIRFIGRATLPQFGTRIGDGRRQGGDLKILLAWGRPTADLLMSWIDHDHSGDSLLVAYFGTMTAAVRRALAVRAICSPAPVIVLDDAALAYLAVHGEGQLPTALAVTLPFSAINPYVRDKRGPVASEMFYGRDEERRQILDPNGTQVIFGGRGLGKSALLRDSKTEFERTPRRLAVFLDLRDVVGNNALAAEAVWDKLRKQLTQAEVLNPVRPKDAHGDSHDAVRTGLRSWLATDSAHRLLILLDEADGFFESDAPTFVQTQRLKALGTDTEFDGRVKVVFAGLHSVQRFAKIGRNGPFAHLAQRPVVIGPLRHQHAFDLIAKPLRALGMEIEPDLVHQINGYCAYQPFLLQMFGHRLIELMHQRRTAHEAGPPYAVTESDVEAVISDHDLKNDIVRVFRDTLNLDSRYNVIANVLAHHAYEQGMDARLSESDLRAECGVYWPQGFAGLDREGFRAYLHEMAGLGVLHRSNDRPGWQLRSLNVLPMIGNPDDVTAELVNATTEQVPHRDHVLQARRLLQNGRTRSPLTEEQIDDLLGEHTNQTRVILGSRATGIHLVSQALDEVVDALGLRFRPIKPAGVHEFKAALLDGMPGDRRIILSDLVRKNTKSDGCCDSLDYALTLRPRAAGVTRSAVLMADTSVIEFWEKALASDDEQMSVVPLRRHTRSTLKTWALDTERFGAHLDVLRDTTSGWPYLIERALSECAQRAEGDVLRRLASELNAPPGQRELLSNVGLLGDLRLSRAYSSVVAFGDGVALTSSDIAAAVACDPNEPHPESIAGCLLAMDLFDLDSQGRYRPEPLVAAAWSARSSA
jgi:Novel STAND NTPase 1